MQKLIFIFLMALSGCGASQATTARNTDIVFEATEQHAAVDKEVANKVELRFEQVIQFQDLSLQIIDIQDSRCAIGVTCIWAGQMVVMLEVARDHGNPVKIKLLHKREAEAVNVLGYTMRLLNIEPHPKKGKVTQLTEQIVQLEIVNTDSD